MRRISAGVFMSVDGVVDADSDWQYPYFDEELMRHIGAGTERTDTALIGRRSFEGYRALRVDHPDLPFIPFLERVQRHVISTTIVDPDWPGTRIIGDDVTARVRELKHGLGDGVAVLGSPSIIRYLLSSGLLDKLGIVILPVIVGSGPRLFPADAPLSPASLDLADSRQLASGAMVRTYEPKKT